MTTLAPVRSLCYEPDNLAEVTAPPYDDIGKGLFRELSSRSEYNIARIDLPRGSGLEWYREAADRLQRWMSKGVLRYGVRDAVLRYSQEFTLPGSEETLTRKSFIALMKIAPYGQGVLPHEKTLDGPREDRFQVFMATRANLSPIFFVYQDPAFDIDKAFDAPLHPVAAYEDHEGVKHELTALRDQQAMRSIAETIRGQQVIIADGHHRYEAARRCSAALREQGESGDNAAHRFVVGMFVNESDPGLRIRATHRILRHPFELCELRERVGRWVSFEQTAESPQACWESLEERGEFAVMVDDSGTYRLRLNADAAACDPLQSLPEATRALPVSTLHRLLFAHGLGLDDETQAGGQVIKFKRDLDAALSKLAKRKTRAVFLMPAATLSDVRRACEAGAFMPQKSTAFFPKAPAGLVIHTFEQGRSVAPL